MKVMEKEADSNHPYGVGLFLVVAASNCYSDELIGFPDGVIRLRNHVSEIRDDVMTPGL